MPVALRQTCSTVDVIVPVHNACADLLRCVESVRRRTTGDYLLWLVDDGSTDPEVARLFARLARDGDPRIRLLRNDANLGFVRTVNRAMALAQHDVVLLNSDTVVTSGWLEKLRRCADSDARIGTVTPFSNNADICSFPRFCHNNPLDECDPELANRAIEAAALPLYPDIPTAVGFCMFIRRALLEAIGLFDAATFGAGYGEENDFCMRAVAAGYRNVLCDDTFVAHAGERSFRGRKQELAERNLVRLQARHPEYAGRVAAFVAADPLRPIRELAISRLKVLAGAALPGILHIVHGSGGGTERHARDLMDGDAGAYRHCLLVAAETGWLLEDRAGAATVRYRFAPAPGESWAGLLARLCAAFDVRLCHVHHVSGCRKGLLQALQSAPVPYGLTIHDFHLACPSTNLLGVDGEFCGGETDAGRCQRCLASRPPYADLAITDWRRDHAALVARAAFVIAPSASAAAMFARYFPAAQIEVVPHGERAPAGRQAAALRLMSLPQDRCHRVAVLGAVWPVKGSRRLERLVERTRQRALPVRWIVIGYTDRQLEPRQDPDGVLTVHGPYDPGEVVALLQQYRIELVVFPSAGPETYCYALGEAWAAGLPVLVPPIGALQERVRESGAGWTMNAWQDEDAILGQLLGILAPESRGEYERRAQCARAAPRASAAQASAAIGRCYSAALGRTRPADAVAMSSRRLREAWLRAQQDRALERFDANAYRAANPDVAAAGVDPLLHFLFFGQFENRPGAPLLPGQSTRQTRRCFEPWSPARQADGTLRLCPRVVAGGEPAEMQLAALRLRHALMTAELPEACQGCSAKETVPLPAYVQELRSRRAR